MSLFKPFGGNRKLFQRNATSRATPPPPEPTPAVAQPAPKQPEVTPDAPPRAAPAANFAFEAEKQRQASLQSEWTQAVDTLGIASRMMKAATEAHRDALSDSAPLVAGIVRQIVERILHGVIAADDDALVRVVHAAVEALPSDVVRLRMNPVDIERIRHLLPEGMSEVLVPDADVSDGCVAETQRASVDASHAAALAAVDEMLESWLASEAP